MIPITDFNIFSNDYPDIKSYFNDLMGFWLNLGNFEFESFHTEASKIMGKEVLHYVLTYSGKCYDDGTGQGFEKFTKKYGHPIEDVRLTFVCSKQEYGLNMDGVDIEFE